MGGCALQVQAQQGHPLIGAGPQLGAASASPGPGNSCLVGTGNLAKCSLMVVPTLSRSGLTKHKMPRQQVGGRRQPQAGAGNTGHGSRLHRPPRAGWSGPRPAPPGPRLPGEPTQAGLLQRERLIQSLPATWPGHSARLRLILSKETQKDRARCLLGAPTSPSLRSAPRGGCSHWARPPHGAPPPQGAP